MFSPKVLYLVFCLTKTYKNCQKSRSFAENILSLEQVRRKENILSWSADEINLSEIPKKEEKRPVPVNDLVKIDGEYKNPSFKPWTVVEPEKESKALWDIIEKDNVLKGIEEIGDGSTCFEHSFEFWGTWRVKQEGITEDFLKDSENWPNGIKITKVKPV